jgi:4-diphosphocytidyl-2-C-methyl-D-erythritol kinase
MWLEETRNDLQAAATLLVPAIGDVVTRLGATKGCMLARMSGSGATVFGLFGSGALAHQAAHELREQWPGYWVAAAAIV